MCDSGIASGLVLYSPDAPATTSPIVTWGMPGYQRVKLWVDDRWIVDQPTCAVLDSRADAADCVTSGPASLRHHRLQR
eukprot:3664893-Rhodomonas_salina.3